MIPTNPPFELPKNDLNWKVPVDYQKGREEGFQLGLEAAVKRVPLYSEGQRCYDLIDAIRALKMEEK